MRDIIKIDDYIRWILTVLLLIGVAYETGKWTFMALFLVMLNSELQSFLVRKAVNKYFFHDPSPKKGKRDERERNP